MRVVVVGLGVQGRKRAAVAGKDVVAIVDPSVAGASHKNIRDIPLTSYDAALLCTPDGVKIDLLTYLLGNGKHALVEKPLLDETGDEEIAKLRDLAAKHKAVCYTAYNHRFEPHFVRMHDLIASGKLGQIYSVRMFYGNGTARLVRESEWRDQGDGVIPDLGSHLIDTAMFWLGEIPAPFKLYSASRFENRAFDHVTFGASGKILLQMEITLLSWRNHFYADVFAENGSAHIQSLCKWGPSSFTVRRRILPSGRPEEEEITLVQPDPTWAIEYEDFKRRCASGESNIANDFVINRNLREIAQQARSRG
jgi:scyllo-inositol 2-dehydrogenase (NADP+)